MPPRSTAVIALALSVPLLGTACPRARPPARAPPGGAVTAIGAENARRQRDQPARRQVRPRHCGREQPQHRSAHLRVQRERHPRGRHAQLVVQNGLGYDSYMDKIEAAAPSPARTVIDVQHLLPAARQHAQPAPVVFPGYHARRREGVAGALSRLQPAHAAFFSGQTPPASTARCIPGTARSPSSRPPTRHYRGHHRTRRRLPAPGRRDPQPHAVLLPGRHHERRRSITQDVSLQDSLFSGHQVKVFVYNQQVTDTLTESFLTQARNTASRSRLRDHASPRLRLPDVDARRNHRTAQSRSRQDRHPEALTKTRQPSADTSNGR